MGALPESTQALTIAINSLEADEDPDGLWRQYVNSQLAGAYQALFAHIDYWLMLKAPSFDCIYQWRLQQEQALAASVGSADNSGIMDEKTLAKFIQFYQRLTTHCLESLPSRMDTVIELNSERHITNIVRPNQPTSYDASDKLLIFTDLDGSLLDHYHYRHDEADATLCELEEQGIPVIPISSKTRSEIELLRQTLRNPHPFISENGAAVYIPKQYFPTQPEGTVVKDEYWQKSFVENRQHWLAIINDLKPEFGKDFTSFADAGIDGIMSLTGLDVHAAARAAHREYGEAIAWHGSPTRQKLFVETLEAAGATVLQGGRFLHVSGSSDKGKALHWLTQQYQLNHPNSHWQTLAIGDSNNDIAMLNQADLALLIPSPVHGLPEITQRSGVYIAPHKGPRGWSAGVKNILIQERQSDHAQLQEHAHG
jgi:D-glycerate 3-kinase